MNRAGIGLVAVLAAGVFGFLSFGVLDRYVYESGFNLNLKLIVLILVGLVIVAVALAARFRRKKAD